MTSPLSYDRLRELPSEPLLKAEALVEAWAEVCEGLEAHLQDRVAMQDEANPAAYLSILRSSIAWVQKSSEQLRAGRWAQLRRQEEYAASLLTRIADLEGENARLREAIKPFARIVPSSLYPADGSEAEGYCVLLAPTNGNPVEFTGADLAALRALSGTDTGEKVGG